MKPRTPPSPKGYGGQARITSKRNALLAKIHIAKKELCLDDGLYREILWDEFGVETAADLSDAELGRLVERFEKKGWKSVGSRQSAVGKGQSANRQAEALKERVGQAVVGTELTELRLRGLVRRICGVDDLKWCGDAVRLKRLLAALGNMKERGDI